MERNINHLCGLCKSIKFQLHFKEDCINANCPIDLWYSKIVSEPITVHSNVFTHYSSIEALQKSAQSGCHLCTLFTSSLERSELEDGFVHGWQGSHGVFIVYGATMTGRSELLRVVSNGLVAELDVVEMPWTLGPTKSLYTLFVAVTHTSRQLPYVPGGPMLYGYPLLEYHPNDEFEVLHIWRQRKELWLARHRTDVNKPIGWIKPKHHRVISDQLMAAENRLPHVWEPSRIARRERHYLDNRPDSARVFSQVLSWMYTCDRTHKSCQVGQAQQLPPRIIDVGTSDDLKEPYLLEAEGCYGTYAALSYRWGNVDTLKTTLTNLEARKREICMADMPLTMQNAVSVTRRLGQRYLWIDALCIVQDSKTDWEHHASQMHNIFTHAWLVISADAASDSASGFLRPRPVLELTSCEHPSMFSETSGRPDKVICPRIPHAQATINESVLSTRAWVLQERLVSRRNVHWTKYEVFWECNELNASERQPTESILPVCDAQSWAYANWRGLKKAVQPSLSITEPSLAKVKKPLQSLLQPLHWAPRFDSYVCWYHIVEEYSKRELTHRDDRLPAVSGLANSFRARIHRRCKYIAGLWSEDLLQALLWRRDSSSPMQFQRRDSHHDTHIAGMYIAPTFSWASCLASIQYMPVYTMKDVRYTCEILDYHTTPLGADEFGQVSGGWIRVKGPMITFQELYDQTFLASERPSHETGLYMDYPGHVNPSIAARVMVLSIRLRRRNSCADSGPFGRRACLLLVPTHRDGEYTRIGYYEPEPYLCQGGFKTWKTTVVTII